MATRRDFHKLIIGRSERLTFVDTDISAVPAKVDTGAYRSAIHASDIHEKDGTLFFTLLGGHPVCGAMAHEASTDDYRLVEVANSFGHTEKRYEVRLKAKLGPKIFQARFTLADRSKKIYPILLGRTMLNGRFLIDTDESAIDRIELKRQYGIDFPNDEEEGREL
jgi:hypothetical protein